jgi:hypothetical protein
VQLLQTLFDRILVAELLFLEGSAASRGDDVAACGAALAPLPTRVGGVGVGSVVMTPVAVSTPTAVSTPRTDASGCSTRLRKRVTFSTVDFSSLDPAPNPDVRTGRTAATSTAQHVDGAVARLGDVCMAAASLRSSLAQQPSLMTSSSLPPAMTSSTLPSRDATRTVLRTTLSLLAQHAPVHSAAREEATAARFLSTQLQSLCGSGDPDRDDSDGGDAPLPFSDVLGRYVSSAHRFRLRRALNVDRRVLGRADDGSSSPVVVASMPWVTLRMANSAMLFADTDLAAAVHHALRSVRALPYLPHSLPRGAHACVLSLRVCTSMRPGA